MVANRYYYKLFSPDNQQKPDPRMDKFLHYVLLGKSPISPINGNTFSLQNFSQHINDEFENSTKYTIPVQPKDAPGRLGGKNVVLDASTNVGIFMVEEDRLGVSSQANFSTVRANCCVFKGKWIYEIMLGTKGVMQLGWSTKNCHFSHEQGVGDTPESFAYDGNRIRKWNVSTAKYGEAWRIGDTISCSIDLDLGSITFYRNGKSMGEAFDNIKTGYGIAYFPTISLSIHESVRLNFGATPLLHPVNGYMPLQDPPLQDLVRARILFSGLHRILDAFVKLDQETIETTLLSDKSDKTLEASSTALPQKMEIVQESANSDFDIKELPTLEGTSSRALLFILAGYFFDKLVKVLNNAYVVEICFFKLLAKHISTEKGDDQPMGNSPLYCREFISKFLDVFWAFIDEVQAKVIMENLITSILVHYRFSPLDSDSKYQKLYLSMMIELLRHEPTRKYLLQNVLFERIKLPLLMHVKSPDYDLLQKLVPHPYLNISSILDPLNYMGSVHNIRDYTNQPVTASFMGPSTNPINATIDDVRRNGMNHGIETVRPEGWNISSSETESESTCRSSSSSTSGKPNSDYKITSTPDIPLSVFTSHKTKMAYENSMQHLQTVVSEIEDLQQEIIKMLLNNRDTLNGVSSRYLFLKKFRDFIRQNLNLNIMHHPFSKCPYPAILCTFHHLVKELRFEWDKYHQKYSYRAVPNSEAFVPCQNFYDDSLNYFDLQRLAGLMSYLKKTYETELNSELLNSESLNPIASNQSSTSYLNLRDHNPSCNPSSDLSQNTGLSGGSGHSKANVELSDKSFTVNPKSRSEASSSSLIELLDGAILLYHVSGHKHTSKMAKVRDIIKEYLKTITSIQTKINVCPPNKIAVKTELERSKQIFLRNALEQARLLAWIRIVVFSKEKQENVAWLLGAILRTINNALSKGGNLYLFLPEFYLETCLNAFSDLKNNFHPTALMSDIPNLASLLKTYVRLVSLFFARDSTKIVNSELRDRLTQALADCACSPGALKCMEVNLDREERIEIVKALLKPYENRPWAQTNWILVRFWKGNGYGFRYTKPPKPQARLVRFDQDLPVGMEVDVLNDIETISHDLLLNDSRQNQPGTNETALNTNNPSPTSQNSEATNLNDNNTVNSNRNTLVTVFTHNNNNVIDYIKPMPSFVYQKHVGEVLAEDSEKALVTVNSILNQLNWAFSEFVGMLQEIQQASSRTDVQVFIDARQLKLCATCFDLTVGLLRALEMISKVCPAIFTAFTERPSAEILLTNLFQLMCQILARVTSQKSAFNLVVSLAMPGLEMVQHFPILSAVAGILIQLIMRTDVLSRTKTVSTLLNEPGFQLSALEVMLGIDEKESNSAIINFEVDVLVKRQFCFKNYAEISGPELNEFAQMVTMLQEEQSKQSSVRVSISEEDTCPICYARPLEVQFSPCAHKSCRPCITHYLMNKRECFFCKSNVVDVEDIPKPFIIS
ncbi:E3 ubiquitin-protein ligase RNF123-like isoform X2 [Gordionus sp. m RMFG-2023]|uniref:E3 ubiquitin-protein ligase RNF123-like isoform X2 n=1 Tax=Gordionus sp. m RMFG-2023 TaxID=3053472 RepID=UPI0031FC83AA